MYRPDYEATWDAYSKRFGTTASTKDVQHLGDEWHTAAFSARIYEQFIRPHVETDAVRVVAELGVGGGKYTSMVAPHVARIYGVDVSSEMLERTRLRLEQTSCEFTTIKTDGRKLDIEPGTVDFFFSIDSCVHIFPYELFGYLGEMSRTLRPNGVGVVDFADWDGHRSFDKFCFDVDVLERTNKINPGAFSFVPGRVMVDMVTHHGMDVRGLSPSGNGRSSVVTFVRR